MQKIFRDHETLSSLLDHRGCRAPDRGHCGGHLPGKNTADPSPTGRHRGRGDAGGTPGKSVPARAGSAQCAGDVGDLWRLPMPLLRHRLARDRRIAKGIRGQDESHFPRVPSRDAPTCDGRGDGRGGGSVQGKFWEMHDMLYQYQSVWSSATNVNYFFESYAESLGLDVARFRADRQSADVRAHVIEDGKGGEARGVKNTPTIFINGTELRSRFHQGKIARSNRRSARFEETLMITRKKSVSRPAIAAHSEPIFHGLLDCGRHRPPRTGGRNFSDRCPSYGRRRRLRFVRRLFNRAR